MSLYTGTAYAGQNNMTAQGCLQATVTHGVAAAKTVAIAALSIQRARTQGQITEAQATTQALALINATLALPTTERSQLDWALRNI